MLWMKVGLGGLLVAMPFVLYQVWLFVAPGLYSHEKRSRFPSCSSRRCSSSGRRILPLHRLPRDLGVLHPLHYGLRAVPAEIGSAFVHVKMLLAWAPSFRCPCLVLCLALARIGHGHWSLPAAQFQSPPDHRDPGRGAHARPDIASQMILAGPMILLYVFRSGSRGSSRSVSKPTTPRGPEPSPMRRSP